MKNLFLLLTLFFSFLGASAQKINQDSVRNLESAEVSAVRWNKQALTPATTKINIQKHPELNIGMDLPQTLQSVPSLIYSSDAGNNIGYTSMKIRGSDATRINVTINGVPYNDAESQGTFFVDIADIISSTSDVVITNGLGSSTHGTGALGASMDIATASISEKPGLKYILGLGSYGTYRNMIQMNTGRKNQYKGSIRLSQIHSDGYIERASSDLLSWQINQSYDLWDRHFLKLLIFGGHEKTGQAWNGITPDEWVLNPRTNFLGIKDDGTYYENQVDDYTQNHAQLFLNSSWNSHLTSSVGLYASLGKGFYEEYKMDQQYSDYYLDDFVAGSDTLFTTSLIRQLWLENMLLGVNAHLEYKHEKYTNILGLGANKYHGMHYGDIVWATQGIDKGTRWYDLDADKNSFTVFDKFFYRLSPKSDIGLDLQYRNVYYAIHGFRDHPELETVNRYQFFSPKISYNYRGVRMLNGLTDFKFFLGRSAKEPIRSDFESSDSQVLPEKLVDIELSAQWKHKSSRLGLNLYYMDYRDQLILTGKISDVGAYIRQNVKRSYRSGLEIIFHHDWNDEWYIDANASIAANKIKQFTQYYDNYDTYIQDSVVYQNTDISYSPNRIAYLEVGRKAISLSDNLELNTSIRTKAVSRQYLDNSQSDEKAIPGYVTTDLLMSLDIGALKQVSFYFTAMNVFNHKYYNNGYTFSYTYGGEFSTERYIFPQATANFMTGLRLNL